MSGVLEKQDESVEDLGRQGDDLAVAKQTPFGRLEPKGSELVEIAGRMRHQGTSEPGDILRNPNSRAQGRTSRRRRPGAGEKSGAGNRDRTGDIQLGKLAFYR